MPDRDQNVVITIWINTKIGTAISGIASHATEVGGGSHACVFHYVYLGPREFRSGSFAGPTAGINDMIAKRGGPADKHTPGPESCRAPAATLRTPACAAIGVACFLLLLLCAGSAGMQATQIPENLCPIIGLAGLFRTGQVHILQAQDEEGHQRER